MQSPTSGPGLAAALAVSEMVARAATVPDACDVVLDAVHDTLGADRSAVLLYDDGGGALRFVASRGLSEPYRARAAGHSPWPRDAERPKPILVEDVAASDALGELRDVVLGEGIRALAFVPLTHAGRLLGKFMVYFDRPHAFADEEVTLARILAAQVAAAIARLRERAAAERARDELQAVLDAVPDAVTVIDPDQSIRYLNAGWEDLTKGTTAARPGIASAKVLAPFELVDEDGRPITPDVLPTRKALQGQPDTRVIGYRFRDARVMRWSRVSARPSVGPDGNVRCAVCVVQDVTQARREASARLFLLEAGQILASSLDVETTLRTVADLAVTRLADWCGVEVVEPDGERHAVAVAHTDPAKVELARRLAALYPPDPDAPSGVPNVVRTGEPEVYNDLTDAMFAAAARDAEHAVLLQGLELRALLMVPMRARGRVLGVISLGSSEPGRRFDAEDLVVARKLADRAAVAIDNARLYAEAQETRERLELAMEAGRMGTWDYEPGTGRFTWSTALAALHGLRAEDLAPTVDAYLDTIHPDDRAAVGASLAASLAGAEVHRVEYRVSAPGGWRWVEARARVFRDAAGRAVRMAGVRVDVTERKLAELRLEQERQRLAVTLGSIGDAVIATDAQGVVTLMNPVAESLTGWTEREAIGQPLPVVFRIFSERTGVRVPDPVAKVLETGRVVGLANHTVLEARDGTRRSVADSAAPIRGAGGAPVGVVLVFRDVTFAQRLERELAKASKLESIGVLAGGIAHDFNNILTSISANVSLAERRLPKDHPATQRLEAAMTGCNRARDLTRQLLTFSRGGAPMKAATALGDVLQEACAFALQGSSVRAHYGIPRGLWAVDADVNQIGQVVHNLALNAAQAMPEGGGNFRVSAENMVIDDTSWMPVQPGRYVQVRFADDGPGIPPDVVSRIFDPFFTTKSQGTGLGLTTAYSIVKRHDGYMGVESILGIGTTFTMLLPAAEEPVAPAIPPSPIRPQARGRVLVMDDDAAVRDLAGECLREIGYEVDFAADGTEALQRYLEARAAGRGFDVVVMDLTVPGGLGGRETIRRLRERAPDVCAIVSSGYSNDPVLASYREYGFAGMIQKPFVLDDFARVLSEVLRK